MKTYRSTTAAISFLLCMALPAWGQQYYLYAPQPVTQIKDSQSQEGILVREIEIKKGDTLFNISRKFSGRGAYFPQILLFNSIKNPNLIYAGKLLKVPVKQKDIVDSDQTETRQSGAALKIKTTTDKNSDEQTTINNASGESPALAPSSELSLSDLKSSGTSKSNTRRQSKKTTSQAKKQMSQLPTSSTSTQPATYISAESATQTQAGVVAAGQKLFEAATKAYRQDDCRAALELLDRYLADNSGSPLAADANLYKAECYLKMSAQ